uniref:Uncharacterized protein n=1 Tax=Anguilla anguilla TaxID=7936 RepID=A0A0E9W8R9_ANGAN
MPCPLCADANSVRPVSDSRVLLSGQKYLHCVQAKPEQGTLGNLRGQRSAVFPGQLMGHERKLLTPLV